MNVDVLPIRPLTGGPKYHWFGYYDKLQFDPSGRYLLGMEVGFEHRSPTPEDEIGVGMVDLQEGNRWIPLGRSRAWCWQQGCMLQWRPGFESEVMWNDRQGDRFVSHILDVRTGARRTLPHPFYALSPDGRTAVAPDFGRVNDLRPGYGYAGVPDAHADELAPEGSGVYRIDLDTGEQERIVSLASVAAIPNPHFDMREGKHYFNHLLFNPDGTRFIFLHRWRIGQGRRGRMFTAAPDGSDLRVIDDYGGISHFIWRDPTHILGWAPRPSHGGAFYLYEDGSSEIEAVGPGIMAVDGHCTYLPGNKWILNDAYPDAERRRELYVYEVATGIKVTLGRLLSPLPYDGEWRCDLHPRCSPDGRLIVIDSVHEGKGRQMYAIDISGQAFGP